MDMSHALKVIRLIKDSTPQIEVFLWMHQLESGKLPRNPSFPLVSHILVWLSVQNQTSCPSQFVFKQRRRCVMVKWKYEMPAIYLEMQNSFLAREGNGNGVAFLSPMCSLKGHEKFIRLIKFLYNAGFSANLFLTVVSGK